MVFEKLEERVIIKGNLALSTPLHIGSAKTDIDIGEVDLPVLKDHQEQPYIPGSSLKGKVRSEAERIARKQGLPVCRPPDTREMCGSLKNSPNEFCICCRIFGTAGNNLSVASKVRFRDAYPNQKIDRTIMRAGVALNRATAAAARGALYTIEAIPAGTSFAVEIVTENLSADEKKMLKAALHSFADSSLGGASSRGMGKVELELHSATVRTPKVYLGEEKEQRIEGQEFQKWWAGI